MQHSSSIGKQRVFEPSYSKEKLRIQNFIEALCPRPREVKMILQEIIWSLTPGRCWKEMTQALAERAVEVASNISHLLEGAEETPQLLDNISELEQTLRDIYVFVQSETQQNPLLSAKDLCVRYLFLDRQLRWPLKPFKQTVKKPLVLCGNSAIQEDHSSVASQQDSVVAEIVSPNNSSAIHASGSFFHNANNIVVHDGAFYAAHNLVIKKVQNYDRTLQGIVEGADVYTPGDVPPKQDIYKGRGYRIYSAYSTAKARAVKIKLYEGSRAKDRCLAAASFSQKVMHPNVLHLIGVSPLNSELPFLVFDENTEWAIESIIASALSKGLKQSLLLGLRTVAGLSSGLDYLHTLLYPFASVGLDHFVVSFSHGNVVISFDPEVLADETCERDQPSGASDGGNELYIFHGLCQKTFDAACKAHYEFQKVQRSDLDELGADHDMDQDRFEEIEADAGTLLVDTKGSVSDVLSASSMSSISESSRRPSRKSNPSAHRRELVWRSQKNETVSLEEIARQFQSSLLTSFTELGFNRRRGRYTRKTAHRCPGYNRIEITLTPDIAQSAIVSHLTPIPHEICPVCKEIVKDAEIFACICGRDDNESIPTVRCSTCSEWHHRPCVSISENRDQSFVCQRCKLKPEKSHLSPSQQEVKREEKARRKEEEIWKMEEEVKRKDENAARNAVEAKKMEEVAKEPDAKGKEQDAGRKEEAKRKVDDAKQEAEELNRKEKEAGQRLGQQLMPREADNFRREEEDKKKLGEEARRREELKERVRKDEEAKQEAWYLEMEARKEKTRQMVEMVEKEETRKREEARLKFEKKEARKKAAEAKREEDDMKRKLEAEEKRKADETAKRREEDSRRRAEARLKKFHREQEEKRLQDESQHLKNSFRNFNLDPSDVDSESDLEDILNRNDDIVMSYPGRNGTNVSAWRPRLRPNISYLSNSPGTSPSMSRSPSQFKFNGPPVSKRSAIIPSSASGVWARAESAPAWGSSLAIKPTASGTSMAHQVQTPAPMVPPKPRRYQPSSESPLKVMRSTPEENKYKKKAEDGDLDDDAPDSDMSTRSHIRSNNSIPTATSMAHRVQTLAPLVPPKPPRYQPLSPPKIMRSTSEERTEAHERWILPVSQKGESNYSNQSSKLKSLRPASRTASKSKSRSSQLWDF